MGKNGEVTSQVNWLLRRSPCVAGAVAAVPADRDSQGPLVGSTLAGTFVPCRTQSTGGVCASVVGNPVAGRRLARTCSCGPL